MNIFPKVFRRPHVEALVATVAGWVLAVTPGVGFIQAMMATTLILAIPRLWALSVDSPTQTWIRRGALTLGFVAISVLPAGMWWQLDRYRTVVDLGVEVAWAVVAAVIGLAVSPVVVRGQVSARSLLLAAGAGLISAAVWVAVGQSCQLDVRFHPLAVLAVTTSTLVLVIARAAASPMSTARVALACFIVGQAAGLFWYHRAANRTSTSQLGYLRDERPPRIDEWQLWTLTDGEVTTVRARSLVNGDTRYIGSVYGTRTGLHYVYDDHVIELRWYVPRDGIEVQCEGNTVQTVMFQSQLVTHIVSKKIFDSPIVEGRRPYR